MYVVCARFVVMLMVLCICVAQCGVVFDVFVVYVLCVHGVCECLCVDTVCVRFVAVLC